jgi:hypothetical protein
MTSLDIILALMVTIQIIITAILWINSKDVRQEIDKLNNRVKNLHELVKINQIDVKNKGVPVMDRDYKDIPPPPPPPIPPTYQTSKEWF